MNYSEAMKAAQEGAAVSCWSGSQFLFHVEAAAYLAKSEVAKAYFGENSLVMYDAYFAKHDGEIVHPYFPTEADLIAEWYDVKVERNTVIWDADVPEPEEEAEGHLLALMEAGRLIYGHAWRPANPAIDTQIPSFRDGGDTYYRFIETAEKFGGFKLPEVAIRDCRTVGSILAMIP